MDKLERNKHNAMAFYDLMFNQGQPREARQYPAKKVEFKRVIAEGDYMVLPSQSAHANGMF